MSSPFASGRRVGDDAGATIRVLVVDDDARVRAGLAQIIASEPDLSVAATADTAAGALSCVETSRPSVALVDLILPDTSTGLSLVRSLAQRPGCPVVAISVWSGLRGAALGSGAVVFVEKGDVEAVLFALRTAARRHRDHPDPC